MVHLLNCVLQNVVAQSRLGGTLNQGLVCVVNQAWSVIIRTSLRKLICDCQFQIGAVLYAYKKASLKIVWLWNESHGVMVSTLDSPHNDPGSIPGSGGAVGIWVYYLSGSATSSARDVKQGCRLCTHAFKIMHGR